MHNLLFVNTRYDDPDVL